MIQKVVKGELIYMVKYLYKVVVLIVVFVGALFYFARQLESDMYEEGALAVQGTESLPYLTLTSQDVVMNRLYGYNGPIDNNIVRESITPLSTDKKITLQISETPVRLTKLQYDVIDKDTNEIYYSQAMNSIEKGTKSVEIELDYSFQTSTEYILSITATTDLGRKVHYFTRLKYYVQDSYLKEKLAFAMQFHKNTFNKEKEEELRPYLEPDGTAANDSLATVNIKSDSDLVTWGKLSPKKLSEPVPTVKEFNMETACFHLNYFVEGTTSSGKEVYHVDEFYRVRYASGHSYLLNFERSLEAGYDPKFTSVQKNQLKLGITNDTSMEPMSSEKTKQLFFTRGGNLYCYDMETGKNKITKLYSAFSEQASYEYREVGDQGIRLLKTDDEGNLFFAVYGYFSRGQYEGKVAIVLYEYVNQENRLDELVYLPIDTTYQQLKHDFDDYGYVSERNVYYFSVANVVYSYNMESRRLTVVAENVTDTGFKIIKKSHCFVWSDSMMKGYGENLTVFNLETEEKVVIPKPAEKEYIRLLGVINENVVYGYVKKKDITSTATGEPLIPCYKLVIADATGKEVKKTYSSKNQYVTHVEVEGNVMTLSRVRRDGKRFEKIADDSILNQTKENASPYSLRSRVTSSTLTEWYIGFPANFVITGVPSYEVLLDEVITSGRSVHLDPVKVPKYYVYALGKITNAYEDPAEAIVKADEQMGVVVSGSHMVVWERSGSFLMNSIAGLEMKKASSKVSNLAACAYMVLKANHFSVDAEAMSAKNRSLYQMLGQYMDEPVNLTGATLEQVLYFVSSDKYVIAMTGKATAVVISGYDTKNVTYYDPATGKTETVSRTEMQKMCEDAGNKFVSYIK